MLWQGEGVRHSRDTTQPRRLGAVRFAQATSALNATGLGSQAGVDSFDQTWEFMLRTPHKGRRPA